jgi:hypothetical protein
MKTTSWALPLVLLLASLTLHAASFAQCQVTPHFQAPHFDSPAYTPQDGCCVKGDPTNNIGVPVWTTFTNNGETYQLKRWRDNLINISHESSCGNEECTQCTVDGEGYCIEHPIRYTDMASHRLFDEFEVLQYEHVWCERRDVEYDDEYCLCGKHGCGLLP